MDDQHRFTAEDLVALVGSRLCHDLVNPLGAIGNGVELLEMTGAPQGPEMALIKDAIRDAQARIRFFRVAFGAPGADQTISVREVRETLGNLYAQSRFTVTWHPDTEVPRAAVKLAFLMLMCVETALPMGGDITVARTAQGEWQIDCTGRRVNMDPTLWSLLRFGGGHASRPLRPSEVQFTVLPTEAAAQGHSINYVADDNRLQISTG